MDQNFAARETSTGGSVIAGVSTIVARDMGIRRAGRWLLRPASFTIAEGVIGVAGAAGTGKSTLLATFGTLRRPSTGVLEVLGHDVGTPAGRRRARAGLGYLPGHRQDPDMTTADLISYAGFFKRVPSDAVTATIRRFGLTDVAGLTLTRLPRDIRFRAGIAAACVGAPRLVLIDAPMTTGLDPRSWSELLPLLRDAAPTLLVTARTVDELDDWCDRVLILARGRLNERVVPADDTLPLARAPLSGDAVAAGVRPDGAWSGARPPPSAGAPAAPPAAPPSAPVPSSSPTSPWPSQPGPLIPAGSGAGD